MKDFYTTCEIAKFCGVSRITVKNWLEKSALPYFRTTGGHRRVARKDLVEFLKKRKYPLEKLYQYEEELNLKKRNLYCWEYFSKHFTEQHSNNCSNCLIYQTQTLKCYNLVNVFGRDRVKCDKECNECEYKLKYSREKVSASEKNTY